MYQTKLCARLCVHIVPLEVRKCSMKCPLETILANFVDLILKLSRGACPWHDRILAPILVLGSLL